jgi:hypothetical protein
MVVRWLIVVLTLIGAIPVRICTCGAAHHHHPSVPPPRDADPEPPGPIPVIASNPSPAEHHDADCHAVKPRPLMSVGLQCIPADVPPVDALAAAFFDPPHLEPASGHALRDYDPPPDRPLFLTFRVLRN